MFKTITVAIVALVVAIITGVGLAKQADAVEPDGHCPTLTHLTGLKSGMTKYHVNQILGSRGERYQLRVIPAYGQVPETKQEVRDYVNCKGFTWSFVFTKVQGDAWRLNTMVD